MAYQLTLIMLSNLYLRLSSDITATLSSSRIFPALELRRSIFLSIRSPCEVAVLLQADLRFYPYFLLCAGARLLPF